MRSIVSLLLAGCVYVAAGVAVSPSAVLAQDAADETGGVSATRAGEELNFRQSYADYALDMILKGGQTRFLESYVDPDEYIVGPGDNFTISFVAGDIANISGMIRSDGSLFIKSAGVVELGHISLREAIDRIDALVREKYDRADFSIQLTDFRFSRLNILGEVSQPGTYYAPSTWRVSDAIELAGGLTPDASRRRIVLRGFASESPVDLVRFRATGAMSANPPVCAGNTIIVPPLREADGYVSVSGLVVRPGVFEAVDGDHLSDYLTYVDGPIGSPENMVIVVSSSSGSESHRWFGDEPEAMNYRPVSGDNVTLQWAEGKREFGLVKIFGAVNRPGVYPIQSSGLTLADLLDRCGGLTGEACRRMIQIYRLLRPQAENPSSSYSIASMAAGTGERGENVLPLRRQLSYNPRSPWEPGNVILVNGDSLYIPRASGMVSVTGAVMSPGLVAHREGEGIDYYLDLAGGLGFDAERNRMVVINPFTGGKIDASRTDELYDSEILYVPRKEDEAKK